MECKMFRAAIVTRLTKEEIESKEYPVVLFESAIIPWYGTEAELRMQLVTENVELIKELDSTGYDVLIEQAFC